MLRFGLGLAIVLLMASSAGAGEIKAPLPATTLFQLKPNTYPSPSARDETIAVQLQLRRQEFLERDWNRFDQNGRATFVTPNNQFEEQSKPKVRIGVIYRF